MSVIDVNNSNFEAEVLNSNQTVIVDFSAVWCGPCQMMKPIFHKLADEMTDVKFCACDIDQCTELAQSYKVVYVPTFIAFKNGKAGKSCVGVVSEDEIKALAQD